MTRPPTNAKAASVYAPCPGGCGALVLAGETERGQILHLDPHIPTFVVRWQDGTPRPRLSPSRGYPVHACP
jgi:hypothetical protein